MSRRASLSGLERRISLRFALLVVTVLTIGIVAFVIVDSLASLARLDSSLRSRAERAAQRPAAAQWAEREVPGQARIISADRVIASGEDVPESNDIGPTEGFGYIAAAGGIRLRVYAVLLGDGSSLQILDTARLDVVDIAEKGTVLLVVTALVGLATYVLGIRFTALALAPVRESMARLERFSADAGHELRTPLASARASLDVGEKTDEWRDAGLRARDEIDRASALVDRLLELARLDPSTLRPERVEVAALMERVAEALRPAGLERSVTVAVESEPGTVLADPVLFERLLVNLADNAVRAATAETEVTLGYRHGKVVVRNVGPAIPDDEIARIFEPFYQSERSRSSEGAGLGLAIVAAIAEAHGWPVEVSSSAEHGTAFMVRMSTRRAS
jgi:signal transduction histidine kinase